MTLTLPQLIACGVAPTQARIFAPILAMLCGPNGGITTPVRMAAFLAQAAHESGAFTQLEESFYYRDPMYLASVFKRAFHGPGEAAPYTTGRDVKGLANRVYAGVNGNGDAASGDGWRFRGRGLFQLTGRANYRLRGATAGRDWIANPDDVAQPAGAVLSALAFWRSIDGNTLADASNIDAITHRINPAMLGAAARRQLFDECIHALS